MHVVHPEDHQENMVNKVPQHLDAAKRQSKLAIKEIKIAEPLAESLKFISPAWPLQSTVAVNPFWFKRDKHVSEVFAELEPVLHQSLFMPLDYYRQKFRAGEITHVALLSALKLAQETWSELPRTMGEFVELTQATQDASRTYRTFAETLKEAQDLHQIVIEDLGKYCAGYFDSQQAIVRYPWQSGSFWEGFFEAQRYDKAMAHAGIRSFTATVDAMRGKSPEQVIAAILAELKLESSFGQYAYMQRLLASMLGWSSQFKYLEWQRSLGYSVSHKTSTTEFLAVRMLYDYAIYREFITNREFQTEKWLYGLNEAGKMPTTPQRFHMVHYVWQLAFEFSFQNQLVAQLEQNRQRQPEPAKIQMIFCIDVRSEMIRRHIEAVSDDVQTMGFAGFFGVPLEYKKRSEMNASHRLPVLVAPSYSIAEVSKSTHTNQEPSTGPGESQMLFSYFKNFRKAPLASFLYVELFGILAVGTIVQRTIKTLAARLTKKKVPLRFDSARTEPGVMTAISGEASLDLTAKLDQAEAVLTNLSLQDGFGDLVIFCGHGATTTNNALASALDCGACGGHAGDINARFVTALLNDKQVREGLHSRGISIPERTCFVPAVHETVTDAIYLLDEEKIPGRYAQEVAAVKRHLHQATRNTVAERNQARSDVLDRNPRRRAGNWSEIRPEWGLAGNACFVVAPRVRTKGLNLSSRAFLHDYVWQQDKDFATLALIMTAPMVVTNWINLQYYGSVVAPHYYGSGNKLLHNITGEDGVVEGNGGDLRIGLSQQSVHDGYELTHEPLRLSVLIEAPRTAIENIINKHKVVSDLVTNEWLHLLQIDPDTHVTYRRSTAGDYHQLP